MSNMVKDSPQKVYVELTTRCNLQCQMCVKYAVGSCIPEDDMSLEVFEKLLPSLGTVENLILNGIGESLLHPDLVEIVTLARQHMAPGGCIGLQSNGFLLTKQLAESLVDAGLTNICLSVDGFDDLDDEKKRGHSFSAIEKAVECLSQVRKRAVGGVKLGLELVLTQNSVQDLPELVNWAVDNDIDYILTSNLFLYEKGAEGENLFNPHSLRALELYKKYSNIVSSKGLDFHEEIGNFRRHAGTKSTELFTSLLVEMLDEAKSKDIQLNFDDLNQEKIERSEEIERLLDSVSKLAQTGGLDIFIPPMQATSRRECIFLRENATFIAVNGEVMACHFLWHTYSCRVLKGEVKVVKRPYGNIVDSSLTIIWNSAEYSNFRSEAGEYEYTPCWTCSQGPCSSLVSDESGFANDCYGSQVPCGHCQWNLGGIRCL